MITLNINYLKDNSTFMRSSLCLQKQGMLFHFKFSVSLSTMLNVCQMNAEQVYLFHPFCYYHQYVSNSISSLNINSKYQNFISTPSTWFSHCSSLISFYSLGYSRLIVISPSNDGNFTFPFPTGIQIYIFSLLYLHWLVSPEECD